ncbi:MAG: phage major capsid protein [Pseudonocardiaceae bacterium]
MTSRTDVESLIPEEVSRIMLGKETRGSAVLDLFRRIPVSRAQVRFPVLSALPTAYWVTGDTGLKQTTEMAWANKFMNIEELAVIMPVPENVIADMEMDIWDSAQPLLTEAFHRALDSAVFFGTNAPASFPTNIQAAIIAASNNVIEGTAAAAGGYFGDIDKIIEKVEDDGFDVTGWVASRSARGKLRAARNADGVRLDEGRVTGDFSQLDGSPISYPMRGLFPLTSGTARIFAGDFGNEFIVGVREDITIKILTEAVIQDNTGAIVFNLAQQDMVGLRLKARFGWQVANTINDDNSNAATRYPAAALVLA